VLPRPRHLLRPRNLLLSLQPSQTLNPTPKNPTPKNPTLNLLQVTLVLGKPTLIQVLTTRDLEVVPVLEADLDLDPAREVAAALEAPVQELQEQALPLALAPVVLVQEADLAADLAAVLEADLDRDQVPEVVLVQEADLAAALEAALAQDLEVVPAVVRDLEAVLVLVAPAVVLAPVALVLVLVLAVLEAVLALEVALAQDLVPEVALAQDLAPEVDLIPVKRTWRKRFVRYLRNVE